MRPNNILMFTIYSRPSCMHGSALHSLAGQMSRLCDNGHSVAGCVHKASQQVVICKLILHIHTAIAASSVVDPIADGIPVVI